MGYRFYTGAVSQYAPVEVEALGVAWALNKARHYIMGCPEIYVGVDHKPLLGIYSSKRGLADIDNSRLRNLADKATRYRFQTFHVKGTENSTPDALYRYPTNHSESETVGLWIGEGWGSLQGILGLENYREVCGGVWVRTPHP